MKHRLLLLLYLLIIIGLQSNPVQPHYISEIWFAENGHIMMEMQPYSYGGPLPIHELIFVNGDIQTQLPAEILLPIYPELLIIDITQSMPNLNVNPEGDTLQICYYGVNNLMEECKWGQQFYNDINPPLPGQSLAMAWGQGNDGWGVKWFKEQPPTPGALCFQPQARVYLTIHCVNQNGNPISNLPVSYKPFYPLTENTDANGIIADSIYAGKLHIQIKHPETQVMLYDHTEWVEPFQEVSLFVQLTLTDSEEHILPVEQYSGLSIYPAPFIKGNSKFLTLQYKNVTDLKKDSYIKIYNSKGQLDDIVQIPRGGIVLWDKVQDYPSGHYLVRLISGNRILDNKSFIVLE